MVVDSNMLQSAELREFLSARSTHIAVVPDFAWFEAYKQQSVDALVAFLSVIGDFPDQITILKSGSEIARLTLAEPILLEDFERADSHLFSEMVEIIRGPGLADPDVQSQLRRLWTSAGTTLSGMHEGAIDILTSLPEMAEQMFSQNELRTIRTNGRYSDRMFASIFGAAEQLWETFAEEYGLPWRTVTWERTQYAYLFRLAVALVIYLLWWIRSGSPKIARTDRVRNDLIDLNFAVYGTYFDGFLSDDKKARWIFDNMIPALQAGRTGFG